KLPESAETSHLNIYGKVEQNPVVSIGSYACAKRSIQSVSIPEPVNKINMGAFLHCTQLRDVSLPTSLRVIGTGAFRGCVNLTAIDLPEGLVSLEVRAFSGCRSLKTITIPRSVTEIDA